MDRHEVIAILSEHIKFHDEDSEKDNVAAYCPFHKGGMEGSPSMYVYVGDSTDRTHTGMAFCHTCGDGWSLNKLLKKLGVSRKVIDIVKQSVDYVKPKKRNVLQSKTSFEYPRLPEQILGVFEYLPKALLDEGFTVDTITTATWSGCPEGPLEMRCRGTRYTEASYSRLSRTTPSIKALFSGD